MLTFSDRVKKHAEHIINVGAHCSTEETTKQALILPMLDILGFNPFDPTRVKAEVGADFPGAKSNERVDYALYCHGVPVMFVEAKAHGEKLANHAPQLSRYFNATPEVAIAAITNGREWRFFTDLSNKNVMDAEPFLTVNFESLDESLIERLYRFRHDEFQPEALRTLAEESIYLALFKGAISASLKTPDADFVRYVASRAKVERQLNARFIESITPLVKQAIEKAVSEMVVSGLSANTLPSPEPVLPPHPPVVADAEASLDHVDPFNPRIVTTYAERRFFEVVSNILGSDVEIQPKDTESYFSILYQGKNNRWLMRFHADKKTPSVVLCIPLTDERKHEIRRAGLDVGAGDAIQIGSPENMMRIAGLVFDVLSYCQDDSNFKRMTSGRDAVIS